MQEPVDPEPQTAPAPTPPACEHTQLPYDLYTERRQLDSTHTAYYSTEVPVLYSTVLACRDQMKRREMGEEEKKRAINLGNVADTKSPEEIDERDTE